MTENRGKFIKLALTSAEYKALAKAAKKDDRQLAAWVRRVALEAARQN